METAVEGGPQVELVLAHPAKRATEARRAEPAMNRADLYAHVGLTEAQARLADLLRDIYSSASEGAVTGERYNDFFETEAQARMGQVMLNVALHGADARLPAFPGDRPKVKSRRPRQGDSVFERVKAAVTVEELASRYTHLERTGPGKLKALCPIHDERTASFTLNVERQRWHCFGACSTGGDVIALAQELMNRGKL